MDAQLVEGMFVGVVCAGLGVVLLAVPSEKLPPILQEWNKRLGKARTGFAVACILLGLLMPFAF